MVDFCSRMLSKSVPSLGLASGVVKAVLGEAQGVKSSLECGLGVSGRFSWRVWRTGVSLAERVSIGGMGNLVLGLGPIQVGDSREGPSHVRSQR